MEKLKLPVEGAEKLPPIFYCSSIAEIKKERPAIIEDGQDFVRSQNGITTRFLYRSSGIIAAARILLPPVMHFPQDDRDLPKNRIVIRDSSGQITVELPSNPQLSQTNSVRKSLGMPEINTSDLKNLQWAASAKLINFYYIDHDNFRLESYSNITAEARRKNLRFSMEHIVFPTEV